MSSLLRKKFFDWKKFFKNFLTGRLGFTYEPETQKEKSFSSKKVSEKSFQTFLKTFSGPFFVHCQSALGSFMNQRHRHFEKKVFRKKFFKKSYLPYVLWYGNPSEVYIREG